MKGRVEKYQTTAGTRWRIRYELPPGPDGRRRQTSKRGFTRERDAQKALRDALGEVEDGTYVDPARLTVREWLLDEWLPARKPVGAAVGRRHRGKVGIGTWASYRGDIDAYVVPRIGHLRLQALTPDDLNHLYDDLEASGKRAGKCRTAGVTCGANGCSPERHRGLSGKTVKNVHGLLHKALKDAAKQGRVRRNAADLVDSPTADRARTDWWTVEQLRRFLSLVAPLRMYAMWLLFATTGMRRGEVAGLTWSDVDLDEGRLRVEWTLGLVDAEPTWKPWPKSKAGERTMALDPATVEALKAWRKAQLEERMAAGPGWVTVNTDAHGTSREDLVFTWPDGRMINPRRISDWFSRGCRAAGLPAIRLHDVRHTYASAALASATGWHEVKVISERLGHASVGITLDTYSHVLPEADRQVADTLARVILGEGGSS